MLEPGSGKGDACAQAPAAAAASKAVFPRAATVASRAHRERSDGAAACAAVFICGGFR
jgi:hypothetical protein